MHKTRLPEGEVPPASQIGATMEALAHTIANRKEAGEESYTYRLLSGPTDKLLKKVMEEAGEVALAAKDVDSLVSAVSQPAKTAVAGDTSENGGENLEEKLDANLDHLRYESADLVYHLLVVLEKYGIGIEEFAAELNMRMTDAERPEGAVLIEEGHINRG